MVFGRRVNAETAATARCSEITGPQVGPAEMPAGAGARRSGVAFAAAGAMLVVVGGFVSAAGGEAPSRHLAWASAYLVLVCGVAQILVGGGQALVASDPPRREILVAQFCMFNLANAGILVGTLAGVTELLDVASALLIVALGLFAWTTRKVGRHRRRVLLGYRAILVVLGVSVPIGVMLAH